MKVEFCAECLEQRNIATAFATENKIRSHANAVNAAKITREATDELLAGLLAERFVERNFQQRVCTERFDGAEFLRSRINEWRDAIRRDDGVWMAIKRDDDGERVVLSRVGDGLTNDLLMAKVNAVEHTDGEAGFAAACGEIGCGVNDGHGLMRGAWCVKYLVNAPYLTQHATRRL